MKLAGILMYCVHWGKSNFTRPVSMSVLDFFGNCPRKRERERDGRGRKKKEHKEERRIYQVRVNL